MILDRKTGETYLGVLYEDAADVLLLGAHGEARIAADQFAQAVELAEEGGLVWAALPRYLQLPNDREEDAMLRTRREELARYAAGNGGQIATHIEPPETPSAPRRALAWVRDTFGSPT